jgi:4-nitrophenyl phosphatase
MNIDFDKKKLFVLDMDGTFYLGDKLLPGSLDFIGKLRHAGKRTLFFTNNSSATSEFYNKKLKKMGLAISEKDIITSGDVTIDFLKTHYPGKKIYLVATGSVIRNFARAGIELANGAGSRMKCGSNAGLDTSVDAVVIAFDKSLTYEKIKKACSFIRSGAVFIATHPDLNCPTEDGYIPDCGSICAMINASTGVKPRYLGKPFSETLNSIISMSGVSPEEIVFVGDRLYTDISIGFNNGISTILVLSGETKRSDLVSSAIQPDLVVESLSELSKYL